MLIEIWNSFLFQPLYNVLIYIYNNWADQNLGWSIIYLTLLLRAVLMPLTVLAMLNARKNFQLDVEVAATAKQFQHDRVLQKQEVRKLLKSKRVSPWAKALSLGIQALVVVLLYEVFLFGLEGNDIIAYLYNFVEYPGNINTMFYGFDIGKRSAVWALFVALWLFFQSYLEFRKDPYVEKKDLAYLFFFPAGVFFILMILPMMKALFFLTSMVFSLIVGGGLKLIIRPPKSATSKE